MAAARPSLEMKTPRETAAFHFIRDQPYGDLSILNS
jgi:hypothetical protein